MQYKESSAKLWRKFKQKHESYLPAKLISWTQVHATPVGMESMSPYIVAIVELSNGNKITTQLVDCDYAKLKYGQKLLPTYRKYYTAGDSGLIQYGYKFKPLL